MDFELLLEAEKRGILPAEKVELLEEARKRGLVGGNAPTPAAAPAPKGFGQKLKENLFGDDDPNSQNWGEYLGSTLNKAGEAMTFGLVGDEASAAAAQMIPGGMGYNDRLNFERQQERVLERDNPGTALAADIGGSVVGALLPLGAVGTLGKGAGMAARMGASAGTGAAMGGTYGAMEGEGLDDRLRQGRNGAVLGGIVGGVAPVIGAGVQKAAQGSANRKAIRRAVQGAPSTEQLRAQGQAAYRAVDDAGVAMRPDRVRSAMDDIVSQLRGEGAGYTGAEKVMPASRSIMDAAGDVGAQSNTVPLQELDMFRRYMGNAAGANLANRGDTRAATNAIGSLDDFIAKLGPDDIDSGDIEALKTALPKARETWARMSRSQLLDDAMENAADYRTGEASGLRAQFQRIVKNDKLNRGFSDAEMKVMRRVVNGSLPEQIVNYMGSGLGMMAQMGAGGIAGSAAGPLGALAGTAAGTATAAGSRKLSESIVRRNAEIARALVASGKGTNMPVISDQARRISEALMRRGTAAIPRSARMSRQGLP